jgi:hypothetical protein
MLRRQKACSMNWSAISPAQLPKPNGQAPVDESARAELLAALDAEDEEDGEPV